MMVLELVCSYVSGCSEKYSRLFDRSFSCRFFRWFRYRIDEVIEHFELLFSACAPTQSYFEAMNEIELFLSKKREVQELLWLS